jgi:hypothetical protein
MIRHLPTITIAIAFCLFIIAMSYYPGGTTTSASTVGYSWSQNFLCSLFAPYALNGEINPARYTAISAMFLLCVALGTMFKLISVKVKPKIHKNAIEIGGIGAMVYGFFAVTPIHDLVISIGFIFSLAALSAITHILYIERRWLLFVWGVIGLALSLISAAMYYGNLFYNFLPVVQKVSWFTHVGWLIAVYYRDIPSQEGKTDLVSKEISLIDQN